MSPGPYRLAGRRVIALKPYSCRYAWAWAVNIFLASPYGAFVSSGYPFHRSSSLNGTWVNFGYAQTVPTRTNLATPASRAYSMRWIPITAFS